MSIGMLLAERRALAADDRSVGQSHQSTGCSVTFRASPVLRAAGKQHVAAVRRQEGDGVPLDLGGDHRGQAGAERRGPAIPLPGGGLVEPRVIEDVTRVPFFFAWV